jgi:hypothetical protein
LVQDKRIKACHTEKTDLPGWPSASAEATALEEAKHGAKAEYVGIEDQRLKNKSQNG